VPEGETKRGPSDRRYRATVDLLPTIPLGPRAKHPPPHPPPPPPAPCPPPPPPPPPREHKSDRAQRPATSSLEISRGEQKRKVRDYCLPALGMESCRVCHPDQHCHLNVPIEVESPDEPRRPSATAKAPMNRWYQMILVPPKQPPHPALTSPRPPGSLTLRRFSSMLFGPRCDDLNRHFADDAHRTRHPIEPRGLVRMEKPMGGWLASPCSAFASKVETLPIQWGVWAAVWRFCVFAEPSIFF